MQIVSTRFGELEIDPESVITFPNGVPGFDGCTRFKLLHEEDSELVQWLQSLDDPDVHFSVVDPSNFNIFYELELTDSEVKLLQMKRPEDVAVFLMLYKEVGGKANSPLDPKLHSDIRGNVKRPLIVDTVSRIGFQKSIEEIEQSTIVREASPQAE